MWSNFCCINAKRRRLLGAALLAFFVNSSAATATTTDWHVLLPQVQALGSGDMTWLGMRIYRAILWSANRPFDVTKPFALQLTYYRSISSKRLVSTSMDEIRRLNTTPLPASTLARWETLLNTAFIDVNPGDELTGVYLPGRGMRLYDRQRLLSEINDETLARAFFDIWLHPKSRDQQLRQHLIGAQP